MMDKFEQWFENERKPQGYVLNNCGKDKADLHLLIVCVIGFIVLLVFGG